MFEYLCTDYEDSLGFMAKRDYIQANKDWLEATDKGKPLANSVESKEDRRIGYTVRLFPSQLKGEIVRVRVGRKGIKKLVVKTFNGDVVEVNDLPYLYEVLKRG